MAKNFAILYYYIKNFFYILIEEKSGFLANFSKNASKTPIFAQKRPFLGHFDPFLAYFWPFFGHFRGQIFFKKWPIAHFFWPQAHFWPNFCQISNHFSDQFIIFGQIFWPRGHFFWPNLATNFGQILSKNIKRKSPRFRARSL